MKKIYKCCGICVDCPPHISSPCYYKHKRSLTKGDKINVAPSKNRRTFDPIEKGKNK